MPEKIQLSSKIPLSEQLRPTSFNEMAGQKHLIGPQGILRRSVQRGFLKNMIFYGPPGVGKTTAASILACATERPIHMLNATYTKTDEIKEILKGSKMPLLTQSEIIYIDEIQNFNKKQQQILLDYIEKGDVVLIASTTENPYHYVYKSLLSRCLVLEFKSLTVKDIEQFIQQAIDRLNESGLRITYERSALQLIASQGDGDVRQALNLLEVIVSLYQENKEVHISEALMQEMPIVKQSAYDRNGDSHYDLLSAFQKSIRGSDPDAALHYLARLLTAQDLKSICRRLLVIASEDIGLAYPNAINIVYSCVSAALQIGLPEAKLPLAQAVLLLCTAPKSNSVLEAANLALQALSKKTVSEIPDHLKDAHYAGAKTLGRGVAYQYPHDFPENYVHQQYLPDSLVKDIYYKPGQNKFEQAAAEYLKKIKSSREPSGKRKY